MFSMEKPQYRPIVDRSWSERIVNSATGLTREMFHGSVSGVDMRCGLADKGATQTQASTSVAAGAIPRRRRRSGAFLACDFRRLREAEEKEQRELEFKRFVESGVGSWKDSEGEGMCGGYAEMQMRGEELERTMSQEQRQPLQQGLSHSFETRWHGNASSSSRTTVMSDWPSTAQLEPTNVHSKNLWQNIDEVEEIWTRSKSAAVSRLQQIQNHLSPEPPKPTRRHILRPIQPLPEDLESFQALLQTLQVQPSKADADNLDITYFHCPHMECHRRLERQNSNLPAEFETRAYVHTGCGFVGTSVEEWVVHCTGEHHGEERSGEMMKERGFCERCMSVEDTHI